MKNKIDKETKELLKHLEKELKESANKSLINKNNANKDCVYKPNDEMEYIAIEIEDEKEENKK